ncbi:MAG: phage major capsid protein [Anaerolineae bacterium]|nr:phage major capsid protein [Anaerolineae bacterium]
MDPQELYRQAKQKLLEAKAHLELDVPDPDKAEQLTKEAADLRRQAEVAAKTQIMMAELDEPDRGDVDLPDDDPDDDPDAGFGPEDKVTKAVRDIQLEALGKLEANAESVVMREIYGGDYRQLIHDQTKAFGAYLRGGRPEAILRRQLWLPEHVKSMIVSGFGVPEIKATMVEGQEILGGFAVPPQISNDINRRIRGLTAIRNSGARIVQTASNSIEWLKITGGDNRYTGNIRGQWGSETANPGQQNMTFGLERINVELYTYKVRISASMLEDAQNIVDVFNEEVADTLAVDEDIVFATGSGAGQPRGLLPNGENKHLFNEVVSGSATDLLVTGVKKLRRGIATQYRNPNRASWLGNSDTASVIENFTDGQGRFYFEYLDNGERFLRSPWNETEAMPDIAAGAYPLLFGDMSGYMIVERLGLAIRRYNDSNTGINLVEFHVRRRVGGDVWQPWKIAAQKVAAAA